MLTGRRFFPSTSLLLAFEAAARTGSITAAARELALTQSAVSRQILALEEQLGANLFHRERQTIRLTPGGESYAREIRDALHRISSATLNLRANPYGGTLNLACLPTFGARWLTPRLPEFLASNPGIRINLMTRMTKFDFDSDPFDAAIHFGAPEWPGAELMLLRHEISIPVASPEFAQRHELSSPESLASAPLLHLATRPDAWERWFMKAKVPVENLRGMLFDQFATLSEAAIAGLGIALLPEFLIDAELANGQLKRLVGAGMESDGAYYLAWPKERSGYPPLVAFRNWIADKNGLVGPPGLEPGTRRL